jgi:FixJ family two-component response regulator
MNPRQPPDTSIDRAPVRGSPGHVVVIDDDPDILDAFCRLIELEGHRCEPHSSARAFLDSLKPRAQADPRPLCVLCDVNLPEMDGLQLQVLLRDEGDVPIILMSGSSGAREAVSGFRAGAVDFLIKPIDADQLLAAIKKALALSAERQLQRRRRQAVSARLAMLSDRELSVARLVASGLTNLGIGLELGISERTVKFHRQHITEKLAISGTTELVRLLEEHTRGEDQNPA